MDDFKLSFLDAIKDEQISENLVSINKKGNEELVGLITNLNTYVQDLKNTLELKEKRIEKLERENETLRTKMDDQEQYTRRTSVRIFGIPETTTGSSDEKVLSLCNDVMKLNPPLQLEEIEVSHRTGKTVPPAATQPQTPRPRAILVRFLSRRTKAHVMASKKKLKGMARSEGGGSDDFPDPVYISDDLTQRRAKLALKARILKRQGKIQDTWVYDCRILVKDNHSVIHQVNEDKDVDRYGKITLN